MALNEDFMNLFSRNLSLNPHIAPQEQSPPSEASIIYSITQHYHHSAHVAAQQPVRSASEPPPTDQLTAEIILARHGVNLNTLCPAQIDLFKTGDPSSQMRLIQLWQLYNGGSSSSTSQSPLDYQRASSEYEAALQKSQQERLMLEERMSRIGSEHGMDADDTMKPYMNSGYEALARREYEESAQPVKDVYSHFGTAKYWFRPRNTSQQ